MKKYLGALLFALTFALPVLASAATVNISVGDSVFNPKTITINQGDTIVWKNNGAMPHTVTADSGAFDSGNLAPGQSFSQTFSGVGTVAYHCTYHGGAGGIGMSGTIVVQSAAAAQATVQTTQTDNTLQAQAQALLQKVAQLQAQLAAQQNGSQSVVSANGTVVNSSTGAAVPVSGSGGVDSSACPNIGRVLKKGSSGDDVTRLQKFLAQDPSIYPEGTVSGYYGALTEKAVQRWQTKFNIVSSGSPNATGYGVVGPRTAAAIALLCSAGGSTSPVGGYIQVSPISGNAPLNVTVVATVNSTNACSGAIYQLNWGDGASPVFIPVAANNCQPVAQTLQHTYQNGGTYQMVLSAGSHQTSATITVFGAPSTGGNASPGESFTATPISGAPPLAVTFSGVVTGSDQGWCPTGCSDILMFGDGGQGAVPLPTSQSGVQSFNIQHTYNGSGSYSAILYQGQAGNGRPMVGTPITISVSGGGSNSTSYNPPSVAAAANGNPLAVTLTFDYSASSCNFSIDWGDGKQEASALTCQGSGIQSTNSTHTYAAPGNYTITLKRDGQVDTAGVNIQ